MSLGVRGFRVPLILGFRVSYQAKQAFLKQIKARNMQYPRAEQHKSSAATKSHTRNTSMQEAHQPKPRYT